MKILVDEMPKTPNDCIFCEGYVPGEYHPETKEGVHQALLTFYLTSLSLMWKRSFGDIGNVMERLFNVLIAVA